MFGLLSSLIGIQQMAEGWSLIPDTLVDHGLMLNGSLDSYLKIHPKTAQDKLFLCGKNQGPETRKPLDRSMDNSLVPKPGEQPTDSDRRQQQGFQRNAALCPLANKHQCSLTERQSVALQIAELSS